MRYEQIHKKAIEVYGEEEQLRKMIEKIDDLKTLLIRATEKEEGIKISDIMHTIVEVDILLQQTKLIFNCEKFSEYEKKRQMVKLERRLIDVTKESERAKQS